MTRPPFASLLIALALLFQSIVGVTAGVARTADGHFVHHHCVKGHSHPGAPAPLDNAGSHDHCQQCVACALDVALLPDLTLVVSRETRLARSAAPPAIPLLSPRAQFEPARGPPA